MLVQVIARVGPCVICQHHWLHLSCPPTPLVLIGCLPWLPQDLNARSLPAPPRADSLSSHTQGGVLELNKSLSMSYFLSLSCQHP